LKGHTGAKNLTPHRGWGFRSPNILLFIFVLFVFKFYFLKTREIFLGGSIPIGNTLQRFIGLVKIKGALFPMWNGYTPHR